MYLELFVFNVMKIGTPYCAFLEGMANTGKVLNYVLFDWVWFCNSSLVIGLADEITGK